MSLFWWREKQFKSVWKVKKDRQSLLLVGSAHFCPYSFEKTLTRLIQAAETVLFEGPLDSESMARVVEYGRQGEGTPSLYEALDPSARKEINRQLARHLNSNTSSGSYLDLLQPAVPNLLEAYTRGIRPWMAFFTVWSALLNWKYSMDFEAYHVAQKLGKKIECLETIEDQLAALDGVPFERFVNYLNHIDFWKDYQGRFVKAYLAGDLEQFVSMTGLFPTRCESILAKRDPIFFKGIKNHIEKGPTTAFIGSAHIPGVLKPFLDEGYQITQDVAQKMAKRMI
jgi:uncharacterized protein YbaP (TraB family)